MQRRIKFILCLVLALFAAASLISVLGSLGALPVGAVGETYTLREVDGRIGVFSPSDADEPFILTEIRIRDLPLGDRLELMSGVSVSDYGAVVRLLEDYGA